MSEHRLAASIANQIVWTHETFITVVQELSEAQLSVRPENSTSPCIAWHFWHAARLADRVQAALSDKTGLLDRSGAIENEHWVQEKLALAWGLDSVNLGVFEIGPEMDYASSTYAIQAGKMALQDYAQSVFASLNAIVEALCDADLFAPMKTVANFTWERGVPGSMTIVPPKEVMIIDELLFYEGHTSRHLGMVEALRGLLMERGTATI